MKEQILDILVPQLIERVTSDILARLILSVIKEIPDNTVDRAITATVNYLESTNNVFDDALIPILETIKLCVDKMED